MASTILCRDGVEPETDGAEGYEWSLEDDGGIISFHDRSWVAGCERDHTLHARWSAEMFRNCFERFCAYGRAMLIEGGRLDCMEHRSCLGNAPDRSMASRETSACLEVARDEHGVALLHVSGWGGRVSRRLPASFGEKVLIDTEACVRSVHEERRADACRADARRTLETDMLQETDLVVVTSPRDPAEGSRRHVVRFLLSSPRDPSEASPMRAAFGEVAHSCGCFERPRAFVDDRIYARHEYENWRRAIQMVRSVLEWGVLDLPPAWLTVNRLHLFVPGPSTLGYWLTDTKYADALAFNAKS